MEHYREYLDRFYVCSNRLDGLYYLAARHLGVNENTFSLLYSLADGRPRSQKQLSEELLIPKTTVNTVVKECIQAGYFQLVPAARGKEKEVTLTEQGRAYAQRILQPIYNAEEQAMARTLEQFSPDFLLAVEALTEQLCRSFQENILNLDRKEP